MLENWSVIQGTLEDGLKLLSGYLNGLHPQIVMAALALPIVLALISRRIVTIVATLLLAAVAIVVLLEPALISTTVVTASYVGSLLAALMGIRSWRRDRAVKTELAALRTELDQLVQAETRRMMAELRSSNDATTKSDPQAPAPQ